MTLFHEQMHGVAKILGDAARGGNAGAAELARALAAKYGAPLAPGEAFNEEAFADAFRDFVAGKIDVAEEERGLFGRFVDFVRSLFARAEEAARERTLMDEFFEQAAGGRAVEAVAADDAAHHQAGAAEGGTFGGERGDIRASIGSRSGVTPEEDAAYMDAVRRGDMETAQRMVREAAEQRGYKLSHGFFILGELASKAPRRTKGDLWAFETGRKLAARGFDNSRYQWEMVDFSEEFEGGGITAPLETLFYGELAHTVSMQAYFDAGVNGDAMPEFVFARRIGIVPDSGQSYNFRDQIGEAGVSVLGVYDANGFQEQNNGTYRLFNGGKEYLVAGYKIEKRGSDGEPLLVRANTLGDAEGAVKSADPVTYGDAGNVIPLSQRFDTRKDDVRYSIGTRDGAADAAVAAAVGRVAQTGAPEVATTADGRRVLVAQRVPYSKRMRDPKTSGLAELVKTLRGTSVTIPATDSAPERNVFFDKWTESEYRASKNVQHLAYLARKGTEAEKEFARKALSAKKSIARFLPDVVASARNERHKTYEEMAIPGHEKPSGRWGGGIYEYDVTFNVSGEQYEARMIVRCNSEGKMSLYDIVDFDDGSAAAQADINTIRSIKGLSVSTAPRTSLDEREARQRGAAGNAATLPRGGAGVNGDFGKKPQGGAGGVENKTTAQNLTIDSAGEGGTMLAQGDSSHGQRASQDQPEPEPDDEFRRIQEESRGTPPEVVSQYHSGERTADEGLRRRLADVLAGRVGIGYRRNGNGVQLLTNIKTGADLRIGRVDGQTFHDVFEIVRQYLKHGDAVDLHDSYGDDVQCWLSEDGLSGFAVEQDGNIVSVFSLGTKGFLRTVFPLIKKFGGTKLDCYQFPGKTNLPSLYESAFGFRRAASMAYDESFEPEDPADERHGFGQRHGMPRIVFMVADPGHAVEEKSFDGDYDGAVAWQGANLPAAPTPQDGDSRSSIGPRDGDGSTPSLSRMDLAVAFAARDAMTGRDRPDEDYARLIKGLGVGAMYTPDELRRAGRAAAATERMRGEGKAGTKAWRTEMRTPSLRALARNARAQRMLEEAIRSAYRFGERAGARAGAKAGTAEAEARRRGEEAARRMLAKMMRSAQGLDVRELDAILGVPAPAHLLRAGATNATERAIVDALAAVLADTRSHMPEAARLSDLELAALYLAQMTKDASTLAVAAPSNTIKYLIGAGIRVDIAR